MSEMVASPTIDLEDDAGVPVQNALGVPDARGGSEPAPAPAIPAAVPAAEPVVAAPAVATAAVTQPATLPEPDLEPKATDDPAIRGLKAALAGERAKNRGLAPQIQAAQFLTQQLQAHPDIANQLDQRIRGVQPPAPAQPVTATTQPASEFSEQQLRETAKDLVLYDPLKPGELDLGAAERVLTRMKGMAKDIAAEAIKPVQAHVQQTKFQASSQRLMAESQQFGIQPEIMADIISKIGGSEPALLDDPATCQMLMFMAKGMSGAPPAAVPPPAPAQVPREPILTESPGGKTVTAPAQLDDLSARVARKLGITHEKYTDTVNKLPVQAGWRHINLE